MLEPCDTLWGQYTNARMCICVYIHMRRATCDAAKEGSESSAAIGRSQRERSTDRLLSFCLGAFVKSGQRHVPQTWPRHSCVPANSYTLSLFYSLSRCYLLQTSEIVSLVAHMGRKYSVCPMKIISMSAFSSHFLSQHLLGERLVLTIS